jgi:hypothetical protein
MLPTLSSLCIQDDVVIGVDPGNKRNAGDAELPDLSNLSRRKSLGYEITLIDSSLQRFVVCTTEHMGLKHLLQRFVFANMSFIEGLENVPNLEVWKTMKSTNDAIKLTMLDNNRKVCQVNEQLEVSLKSAGPWNVVVEDTDNDFFQITWFEMTKTDDMWSVDIHLSDIGCVLCRFLLVLGDRAYWCNTVNTTYPIVAYALREQTNTRLTSTLRWHIDRPGRSGPLLNFVRSTGDSGSSTEILLPFEHRVVPYDNFDGAKSVICNPFTRDRTVIFNGQWYHRAPTFGGAREFLQVDFQDETSNKKLVRRFLEWVATDRQTEHI